MVVIGSGPAGATTARYAADHGLKVLLVDKKQELGAPIQCSGAVSAHALADVEVFPDDEFVLTPIYGFIVYDQAGKPVHLDYRKLKADPYANTPLGYVVDRRRFDRALLAKAEAAGVETWLKTEAMGIQRVSAEYLEVNLRRLGREISVRTRILAGADGVQSQVGKWFGLRTHIKLSELASCLQYVVDGVETEGLLEIMTGHRIAPGGYAWIFPKQNHHAEVGLGVIRTMTDEDAHTYLERLINDSFLSERLKNLRILEIQGGGVPLAAPLKQQYSDNMLLVGDAARHVNPITGGGIHTALRCGAIAGRFIAEVVRSADTPTAERMSAYQQRWAEELGDSMWRLYRRKRDIFRERNIDRRNEMLFETLSYYFSPESEYRKI